MHASVWDARVQRHLAHMAACDARAQSHAMAGCGAAVSSVSQMIVSPVSQMIVSPEEAVPRVQTVQTPQRKMAEMPVVFLAMLAEMPGVFLAMLAEMTGVLLVELHTICD